MLDNFYPDQLFASSVTIDHPTSDLQQEPPDVAHQTNVRKDQEQPTSRDIVGVDKPTNLSGDSLRPDQPTTSLEEKELEFFYYRPKLPIFISPKFVLPVPQVKGPRLGKRTDKMKKIVVLASSPFKSDLEMEEKERKIKLQEK